MWVDYSQNQQGKIGNIFNLGNTVILYLGLVSILVLVKDLLKRWDWSYWFIVLTYFMVWVPWSFSPRIMLFYHYTPAIPMLCIALSVMVIRLIQNGYVKTSVSILALSLAWFVVFYPNNVGIPVDKSFVDHVYHFLSTWK
jgi:dolichyl-phosphate-mannose--protein O-mannosyl transferase